MRIYQLLSLAVTLIQYARSESSSGPGPLTMSEINNMVSVPNVIPQKSYPHPSNSRRPQINNKSVPYYVNSKPSYKSEIPSKFRSILKHPYRTSHTNQNSQNYRPSISTPSSVYSTKPKLSNYPRLVNHRSPTQIQTISPITISIPTPAPIINGKIPNQRTSTSTPSSIYKTPSKPHHYPNNVSSRIPRQISTHIHSIPSISENIQEKNSQSYRPSITTPSSVYSTKPKLSNYPTLVNHKSPTHISTTQIQTISPITISISTPPRINGQIQKQRPFTSTPSSIYTARPKPFHYPSNVSPRIPTQISTHTHSIPSISANIPNHQTKSVTRTITNRYNVPSSESEYIHTPSHIQITTSSQIPTNGPTSIKTPRKIKFHHQIPRLPFKPPLPPSNHLVVTTPQSVSYTENVPSNSVGKHQITPTHFKPSPPYLISSISTNLHAKSPKEFYFNPIELNDSSFKYKQPYHRSNHIQTETSSIQRKTMTSPLHIHTSSRTVKVSKITSGSNNGAGRPSFKSINSNEVTPLNNPSGIQNQPRTNLAPSQTTSTSSGPAKMKHTMADYLLPEIDGFAVEIFEKVISNTKKHRNIIISPLSIQTALTLLYCGSKGKTEKNLKNGLHLDRISTKSDIAHDFHYLLAPYQNVPGSMSVNGLAQIANALYVAKPYKIRSKFQSIAKQDFYSTVKAIDFSKSAKAAKKINDQIKDDTDGKIIKLISAKHLNSHTKLILVNAIYFNGYWKHQFQAPKTCKQQFYTSSGTVKQVDMMYQQNKFAYLYLSDIRVETIKLDYYSSDFSIMIFLPKNRNGIDKLENDFVNINISSVVQRMSLIDINLNMPKFKIDTDVSLKKDIKQLGMGVIFDKHRANFNDIAEKYSVRNSTQRLYVSEVRHKARISVTEEGTVAVAATQVTITTHGGRPMPILPTFYTEFNANHSFLFVIINCKSDVLFSGRYGG